MSQSRGQNHSHSFEWSLISGHLGRRRGFSESTCSSHSGRKRGFSESTCSSLLSISDSEYSIRTGSTFLGSPITNLTGSTFLGSPITKRPLPQVPKDEGRALTVPLSLKNPTNRTFKHTGVHHPGHSTSKRSNRRGHNSSQGKTHTRKTLKRRTLIIICVASFTLCIIETTLLVVAFFKHGTLPWDDFLESEVARVASLACVNVLSQLGTSESHVTNTDKGGERQGVDCCERQFTLIAAVVELMFTFSFPHVQASQCSADINTNNPVRASIHIQRFVYIFPDQQLSLPLRGRDSDDAKSVATGVLIENNAMVIIYSGWYLVYVRISSLLDADQPCAESQETEFMIFKHGQDSPVTELCLSRTQHNSGGHCPNSNYNSYTGGIFHLSEGERILVKVSGNKQLKFDTYLGVYLLSASR